MKVVIVWQELQRFLNSWLGSSQFILKVIYFSHCDLVIFLCDVNCDVGLFCCLNQFSIEHGKYFRIALFFCIVLSCDWSGKLTSLSQPINGDLVTHFPCPLDSFLDCTLSSHRLLVIFSFLWLAVLCNLSLLLHHPKKRILFVGFFALLHSPLLYSTFFLLFFLHSSHS